MAKGRIDVYFHSSGSDVNDNEEIGTTSATNELKASSKSISRSAMSSAIVSASKQAINYSIAEIGDLTGNYQMQRNMQSMVTGVSTLIMMANFPVGTIAGAFQIASNIATTFIDNKNANIENAMLRKRAGNETTNNSESD